MKKIKNLKIDVNTIVAIIIVAVMSAVGIHYMEYEWCEWMTGVIWLAGELMIVGILLFKPVMKFIMEEAKSLYQRMLED